MSSLIFPFPFISLWLNVKQLTFKLIQCRLSYERPKQGEGRKEVEKKQNKTKPRRAQHGGCHVATAGAVCCVPLALLCFANL